MIGFLKNIWGFVRPYRGRFFLGLLCGVFYGLTNGLLLGVSKVVMQLTFKNNTDLQKKLEGAPHWIQPLSHWLADRLPDLHAPDSLTGRLLVVGVIPAVMLVRITLGYLSIYLTNWSAMHAIADLRTKLFAHLQNLSLGFFNRSSTGDLIARITNDTVVLYGIIGGAFSSMVRDPEILVWRSKIPWSDHAPPGADRPTRGICSPTRRFFSASRGLHPASPRFFRVRPPDGRRLRRLLRNGQGCSRTVFELCPAKTKTFTFRRRRQNGGT